MVYQSWMVDVLGNELHQWMCFLAPLIRFCMRLPDEISDNYQHSSELEETMQFSIAWAQLWEAEAFFQCWIGSDPFMAE